MAYFQRIFDAPSLGERVLLDWLAYGFLAVSPVRGDRRVVTPLLGFSWGFHVADDESVTLEPITVLSGGDWESHIPYLRACYPEWSFVEMLAGGEVPLSR